MGGGVDVFCANLKIKTADSALWDNVLVPPGGNETFAAERVDI